jgi:hypothetical protein
MELVLKDLPAEYERKIKAIHILSEGKADLNDLLSRAVCAALDGALMTHCNVQMPTPQVIHVPFVQHLGVNQNSDFFPKMEVTCNTGTVASNGYASVNTDEAMDSGDELFSQPRPHSLSQQLGINDETYEGLGDEADFEAEDSEIAEEPEVAPEQPAPLPKAPRAKVASAVVAPKNAASIATKPKTSKVSSQIALAAAPTSNGPNPPADEDDDLFGSSGDPVNGPSDPEFDDLTSVPDDMDDDDSLYADASASYEPRKQQQPPGTPKYAGTGPKAEDFGLKDLGSDTSSMGFFDAQLGGGNLPAYARADRRGAAAPSDDMRRPASLPSGEDVGPSAMGRKPRVRVSGAK